MATIKRRASSRRTPRRYILKGKKNGRRGKQTQRNSRYGAIFFAVLAVTVASTLGFFGVVASVLAGS